jgi:threonylcarbamoyladenosine tRNA methylthiotransferase MtaB
LIDVMAEHPDKVAPHLHISMQSGSDSVLRRMRRRWGAQRFVDRCGLLKERLDRPAITTDVIVGFPGETDAEFAETVAVCRQAGFSKIHMFPFSPRRGTPAAEMADQISKQTKHDRGVELGCIEAELRAKYYASLEGMPLRVLVESPLEQPESTQRAEGFIPSAPQHIGTSCRYAPVALPADLAPLGQFVDVIAGPAQDSHLTAELAVSTAALTR